LGDRLENRQYLKRISSSLKSSYFDLSSLKYSHIETKHETETKTSRTHKTAINARTFVQISQNFNF